MQKPHFSASAGGGGGGVGHTIDRCIMSMLTATSSGADAATFRLNFRRQGFLWFFRSVLHAAWNTSTAASY